MSIDTLANKGRPIEILLVEDNIGDAILTKKAFKAATLPNNITVAEDGNKALAILRKQGNYASAIAPDMIFLDLNLPGKSGQDVLKEIKADEQLKHIPVIVLTSSRAELDVIKSYGLHANSYIVKPVNVEKFTDVVKSIESFWLTLSILPDQTDIHSN